MTLQKQIDEINCKLAIAQYAKKFYLEVAGFDEDCNQIQAQEKDIELYLSVLQSLRHMEEQQHGKEATQN
jgi:hypothetical protein